jgi:30S ribosomal protein S31
LHHKIIVLNGDSMGKGDKRTKKGKIFKGSYGKSRPHDPNKKKAASAPKTRPQRGQPSR